MNIPHTQYGIINKLCAQDASKISNALDHLTLLSSAYNVVEGVNVPINTLITGYGVAETANQMMTLNNDSLRDKQIYIQGSGNVGAACAYYFHKLGAKIIAISDRYNAMVNRHGIDEKDLLTLLSTRKVPSDSRYSVSHKKLSEFLLHSEIDIVVPAARSALVTENDIKQLKKNGLKMIVSGANNPFNEDHYCYGECSQYADRELIMIPGFFANMGMARAFDYLILTNKAPTQKSIFLDVKNHINTLLHKRIKTPCNNLVMMSLLNSITNKLITKG